MGIIDDYEKCIDRSSSDENRAKCEAKLKGVQGPSSKDPDKQCRLPLFILPDFLKTGTFMLVLFIAGCATIGPKSVIRDRFDYNNTAISDSWKEQTLLNIVKLRYADIPLFVEVASIVSGYTLESSVSVNGALSTPDAIQGDTLSLGGNGKFTDRPTITNVPITGSQFNKSFMTPIPPDAVLFLMQSGWSAELIFPLTVDAVNGLRSQVFLRVPTSVQGIPVTTGLLS